MPADFVPYKNPFYIAKSYEKDGLSPIWVIDHLLFFPLFLE